MKNYNFRVVEVSNNPNSNCGYAIEMAVRGDWENNRGCVVRLPHRFYQREEAENYIKYMEGDK